MSNRTFAICLLCFGVVAVGVTAPATLFGLSFIYVGINLLEDEG